MAKSGKDGISDGFGSDACGMNIVCFCLNDL